MKWPLKVDYGEQEMDPAELMTDEEVETALVEEGDDDEDLTSSTQ